ncbi:hypothetical protein QT383_08000 [Stenotrophomonas rhizophila]
MIAKLRPGIPFLRRHREVGAVGHVAVDETGQRVAQRLRREFGERAEQRRVARPGFKQHRTAAAAAGFQIDDRADTRRQRMRGEERTRAEQAGLLRIGEQEDHVTLSHVTLQRTRDLQHHRHAEAIVGCAGRMGDGVVVRHQQHRRQAAIAARQYRNHVLDIGRPHTATVALAVLGSRLATLHGYLESGLLQVMHQLVANLRGRRRAGGMRIGRDPTQMLHRACRRELGGGDAGRLCGRSLLGAPGGPCGDDDTEQQQWQRIPCGTAG